MPDLASVPRFGNQRHLFDRRLSFLTQLVPSSTASNFVLHLLTRMVTKFGVDRRRFSWLIFAISMLELVLWAAPPVSAIASSGSTFTTGDLYRNHILKDKDHYTHATGLNQQIDARSPREEAIERLLEQESRVCIPWDPSHGGSDATSCYFDHTNLQFRFFCSTFQLSDRFRCSFFLQSLTSGKESLQPDSKWNIITWSLMTAVTLALGMASRQSVSAPVQSPADSKTSDEPESSASRSPALPKEVSPVNEVVEVQKLAQLGEKIQTVLDRPLPSLNGTLTIAELSEMTDEEILQAMEAGRIAQHELEDRLDDTSRAVTIRRKHLASGISHTFDINAIPFENYDYDQVKGKCCENVIGYVHK
jgi:hypothetical protein